jgi:TRAP transporter TAXI family solute receptor
MGRHSIYLLYVYYLVVPLVGILSIIISFFALMPPREIVILAGPEEGYFANVATTISKELASFGISAQIEHIEDTTHIIDKLNSASKEGPHLGFVAHDLSTTPTDGVFSLGMISLEPLWLFAPANSDTRNIRDLKGKVVSIGPEGSGVRALSQQILGLYGIVEANTKFVEFGIMESTSALGEKRINAAFFLESANTSVIEQLNSRTDLQLIGIDEAEALSHKINHLERVVIPKGAFNVRDLRPPNNVETLALPVTVITSKGAGDTLSALVANILRENYARETLFTKDYELPYYIYNELEPHPAAVSLYDSGLPYWTKIFGKKYGLIISYAAHPIIFVFFSAVVIFGLVITYAEFIPILISVRDLFRK